LAPPKRWEDIVARRASERCFTCKQRKSKANPLNSSEGCPQRGICTNGVKFMPISRDSASGPFLTNPCLAPPPRRPALPVPPFFARFVHSSLLVSSTLLCSFRPFFFARFVHDSRNQDQPRWADPPAAVDLRSSSPLAVYPHGGLRTSQPPDPPSNSSSVLPEPPIADAREAPSSRMAPVRAGEIIGMLRHLGPVL